MRIPFWLMLLGMSWEASAEASASKMIYGLHEQVFIEELGVTVPAKLDTGADSASLSARYIKTFTRDGQQMVEFDLAIDRDDREELGITQSEWDDIELPLAGHVRIKQRAESLDGDEREYRSRPVVMLTVCMGKRQQQIEVNLTDRSEFSYPMLMGSHALQKLAAVVDPSMQHAAGAPRCESSAKDVNNDEMTEAAEAQ